MTEFKEIYLSSLSGKQLELGRAADSDGNGKLTGSEISIFLVDCESVGVTYGEENTPNFVDCLLDTLSSLFTKKDINKETYGDYKVVTQDDPLTDKKVKIYDNTKGDNNDTRIETSVTTDNNGNVTVNYERIQSTGSNKHTQKASFMYNIAELEEHVIKNAYKKGQQIEYFKDIYEIRALPENERTQEQKELLEEFNNLIKYVTEAGTEYGVDPKQILSIIQEEVQFDGLGKKSKVTGKNGKGYMQLTTIAIADMLNCTSYKGKIREAKFDKGLKLNRYGVEVIELFESRGFKIQEAKTTEQKRELLLDIMNYLIENKDPEFNIRLGTIKLRQNLNDANGDFGKAAFNYNGNPALQKGYRQRTTETFKQLAQNGPNDSTYTYKKTKIV